MTTPEGRVKGQVNRALKPIARLWKFMPVQQGYGIPALDYLICVNGRFIAIETKARGKSLTTRQQQTKLEMEAAGAKVFIVDSPEALAEAVKWIHAYAGISGTTGM